jgi:hypothetical protein
MDRRKLTSKSSVDEGALSVFGPPALFVGEDRRIFDAIAAQILVAVKRLDFVDNMLAHDVIVMEWEVLRWRRIKAGLISSAIAKNLESALHSQNIKISKGLIDAWIRKDTAAIDKVNQLVNEQGVDLDRAIADCLVDRLDQIDKIDDLSTKAEARRTAHLREVERRRPALGYALSDAVKTIEAKPTSRAA